MGESRMEDILEATINGKKYTEPSGSRIETLLIELNELIIEGGGGGSSTAYATALSLTINSSTYVMTAQLLNKDGDPIGTAQTVDLPLESVVVGATYDNTTKSIILTLQSGSTTSVPVGDLVAGLVSTSDLETALSTKQDTISDLSTIRSNATAGAGAAEVVTGIDSTANNYLELKSGRREYLSTTVPTGNIPTGGVGMGFDEGVYTYKSGTKASEGVEIADSSDPHYQQKKFPFYANGSNLTDYTIYGATGGVGDKTAQLFDVSTTTHERIIWSTGAVQSDDTYTMSDYIPVEVGKTYTCSTNVWFIGYDSNGTYLGTYNEGEWNKDGLKSGTTFANSATLNAAKIRILKKSTDLSTVMLNEGSTAQTFEPYGYKIPVICGGTTTTIYLASPLGANDSIDYATAQVAIPTTDGANNLICDTSVQPSKVSLTYTGWHSDLDEIKSRLAAIEQAIAQGE